MNEQGNKLSQMTACVSAGSVLMGTLGAACASTAMAQEAADLPDQVKLQRVDQAVTGGEEQITGVPGSPNATITTMTKRGGQL